MRLFLTKIWRTKRRAHQTGLSTWSIVKVSSHVMLSDPTTSRVHRISVVYYLSPNSFREKKSMFIKRIQKQSLVTSRFRVPTWRLALHSTTAVTGFYGSDLVKTGLIERFCTIQAVIFDYFPCHDHFLLLNFVSTNSFWQV